MHVHGFAFEDYLETTANSVRIGTGNYGHRLLCRCNTLQAILVASKLPDVIQCIY